MAKSNDSISAPTREGFIAAVRKVLTALPYSLRLVKDAAELVKTSEVPANAKTADRRLWLDGKVEIRVSEELDVEADGIIADHALGTLAILHWLNAGTSMEAEIRKRLDRAAYLRHLLVQDSQSHGSPPFAVEIVFGTANDGAAAQNLKFTFDSVLRRSSHLYSVGVNLWCHDPEKGFEDPSVARRAVPWLLVYTDTWLRNRAVSPPGGNKSYELTELSLTNFRSLVSTTWNLGPSPRSDREKSDCDESHRLHLVHGHNGSGKSSLTEALELLVTGKVARIQKTAGNQDHQKVLRYYEAEGHDALLTPVFTGESPPSSHHSVVPEGIGSPLNKEFPANGFRMHQAFEDELSQATPAQRAELLLEAFFPAERTELDERARALQGVQDSFTRLPKFWQEQLDATGGKPDASNWEKLNWIATPPPPPSSGSPSKDTLSSKRIQQLLPLDPDTINALLLFLDPTFQSLWGRKEMEFSELLTQGTLFDDAMQMLARRGDKVKEALPKARQILSVFGGQLARSEGRSPEELPSILNQWLESRALFEILTLEETTIETITAARAAGYDFQPNEQPLLANPAIATRNPGALKTLETRLGNLRGAIQSVGKGDIGPRGEPLPDPRQSNLEVLDLLAQEGVFGASLINTQPRLSFAVSEAARQGELITVHQGTQPVLTVGGPDWARQLMHQLQSVEKALLVAASKYSDLVDPASRISTLLTNLRRTADAAGALSATDVKVQDKFVEMLGPTGPISPALNELLALLTTARWGYGDLATAAKIKGADREVAFNVHDLPTSLQLNTAELNLVSLSLFLLCAPANPNPLHFIVLDDPLQNMDELTVATVVRGLGRFLRLFSGIRGQLEDWRLIILLHREEDIQRFRFELPCITHLLPWLALEGAKSSAKQNANSRIPRESSRLKPALQRLGNSVGPSPG